MIQNVQTTKDYDLNNNHYKIKGLSYINYYITSKEEEKLLNLISRQEWNHDLKRRVQHYGYKYDYRKRKVNSEMFIGDLPDWLFNIAKKLFKDKLFPRLPDQVIINEYNPGQGISKHIDCSTCFSDTIISLSLGSSCLMEFIHSQTKNKISVKLEPCSIVILKEDARYKWMHRIAARKSDLFGKEKISRSRRVSLTFRKVINVD